ncbi:YqaS [Alkaliphilus metalliredigens QYMF]|uniref:YqaS n=1 Tax=Alkaliphilus metalliredigens (strain QYMF) TaxID=293826 RepID=A6TQU4_ALKMQ|nr:phage terminase small subunit [Alkaliphilus metalliredigens]ABR48562.1 YqaS [Alkaliphilus metalliredigens QYMF]
MGRQRSPNRDKAYEVYKEKNGKITSKEIAEMLKEKLTNINSWRVQDKWKKKLSGVGAPEGNKNAVGNKGGAPEKNYNSLKHGQYTKRIPFHVKTIMEELDIEDPLEKLWRTICLHEARIIYMQEIMHVRDKDDMTKVIKKTSEGKGGSSKEYEIQFAWDKEANLINTQSKAVLALAKLIKQYDEMIHANWETVTEDQKLRVERLKIQIDNEKLKAW